MATILDNPSQEKITELLRGNYVLSKRVYRGQKINRNILQLFIRDETCHLIRFDCYGNKIKNKSETVNSECIGESVLKCHSKEVWTYHKQRVAAKEKDSTIVDEESAKILVYEWLISRYGNDENVIVPEITLGNRRADYMAFAKQEICIVEIKSEVDTIKRLQDQLNQYIIFANLVYIAIHKNKIDSIKSLNVPSFVGIIEISDKLKVIKKAVKQKIDFSVYRGSISYQEYVGMKLGFKGSSAIKRFDIELIFESHFTKKQKSEFLFELMKHRHKTESKKRLEAFKHGDFKKAIGNAQNVGVNRMSQNSVYFLGLKKFFNLDENFIGNYIKELENKILKLYKKCNYLELLKNDKMFLLLIIKKLQIPYRFETSKLVKLFLFINNSKKLLENKEVIKGLIDAQVREIVDKASLLPDGELFLVETHSKEAQKLISDELAKHQLIHEVGLITHCFYGVLTASMFNGCNVLVLNNKIRKYFHLEKNENIQKIELWR